MTADRRPLRAVITDDQALVRTGLTMILAADGIEVTAEAADGAEAFAAVRRTRPGVALMDIRMPDHYVYAALTAGASGFLLKEVTPEHLVSALRLAQTGDALLAPTITRRLIERFAVPDEPRTIAPHRDLSGLTPRELEVLRLLATRLGNAELASRLFLSPTTVKSSEGSWPVGQGLLGRWRTPVQHPRMPWRASRVWQGVNPVWMLLPGNLPGEADSGVRSAPSGPGISRVVKLDSPRARTRSRCRAANALPGIAPHTSPGRILAFRSREGSASRLTADSLLAAHPCDQLRWLY